MTLTLSNKTARHIAIQGSGLSDAPTGPCDNATLLNIIKRLGYVQLDPLQVVAKAQDHILWSRNNNYKPKQLEQLLETERAVFEHFSHDACFLPMDTLPYWQNQFKRQSEKRTSDKWRKTLKQKDINAVLSRLKKEGPLRSNDFSPSAAQPSRTKSATPKAPKPVWTKPEHKKLLDYLWLKGDLAVAKRPNFTKYYDLADRVFPSDKTTSRDSISDQDTTHWLAMHAIKCLGFATPGELMRFWEAQDLSTVRSWCENQSDVMDASVQHANGETAHYLTHSANVENIKAPTKPTKRLRLINPFDPLVRDRKRLLHLFGFDYKIEIYVPAKQRQYGYYVYPLLEYDQFIGRIDLKHNRESNVIEVKALWPEHGIQFGKGRMDKLNSELDRLRRFCGASGVMWD